MKVSGQLYSTDSLSSGKEPSIPIGYEAGWALQPVWTRWRREKNPCPYRESVAGRPARSLVTILAEPLVCKTHDICRSVSITSHSRVLFPYPLFPIPTSVHIGLIMFTLLFIWATRNHHHHHHHHHHHRRRLRRLKIYQRTLHSDLCSFIFVVQSCSVKVWFCFTLADDWFLQQGSRRRIHTGY